MSYQSVIEIIILFIIPVAIIGFYFPQKLVEHGSGKKVGRKPILIWGGIIGLIYFAGLFLSLFDVINTSIPQSDLIFAMMFLPVSIAFINLTIRQLRAYSQLTPEDIIYDLGKSDKLRVIFNLVIMSLNGSLLLRTTLTRDELNIFTIVVISAFLLAVVVFWIVSYFSKTYVVQEGILYSFSILKWEQLNGFQWGKAKENKIPLTIKGGREIKVHIPIEQKEQVEGLFISRQVKQLKPTAIPIPARELPPYEIEYQAKKKAIEAARPKIPFAPLKSRLVAILVDGFIILSPLFFINYIFLGEWAYAIGPYGRLLSYPFIIAYIGYYTSEKNNGQTIGQRTADIAVVDHNYRYLSLGRACLRATLLCLIFLLVQWRLPILDNRATTTVVVSIITGVLLATLYSYLFNGTSRQGLHDLLVGSYVVKWPPITEAPLPQTSKLNRIIAYSLFALGFLLFYTGSVLFSTLSGEFRAATIRSFRTLETTLEADEDIFSVHVSESPVRYSWSGSVGGTLTIDIWMKHDCGRNYDYCDQLREEVAQTVFEELDFIGRYSKLQINTANGFDFGLPIYPTLQGNTINTAVGVGNWEFRENNNEW